MPDLPPLRLGILGCGRLLQKGLLRHLLQEDFRARAAVVALCDATPGRAESVAREHAIAAAFVDLAAMLAQADVGAMLVLTPVQLHHEHAMTCLAAGRHVYVQKAMALRHADADAMVTDADARGLILAAAPGQMLCPAYQEMRRIVTGGGLGQLMWCCAGANTGGEPETMGADGFDSTWHYRRGGGALWNTTVYSLHALTGILGPALEVSAMTSTPVAERTRHGTPFAVTEVDNAALTLRFDDGILGLCWGCRSASGRVLDWGAIGFYGTEGSVEASRIHGESGWPEEVVWHGRVGARNYRYPMGGFGTGDGWPVALASSAHAAIPEQHVYLDILDWVTAIQDQRAPVASARHAAHVVEIIEKTYLAAETGRAQRLASTHR